jgi:tripartite-type tricarboxylate transporter receptor subunit TctC
MQIKRYWLAAVLLAVTSTAFTVDRMAHAQNYPARPVKLIVPYAAGGPNDIVARLLAQKLQEALGGNFFVENLPGGGGTIGTGNAANAAPDGYTLLVANQDIILQPIIRAKVPYDPFKSFAPLSLVVSGPELVTVHSSLPVKDTKELLALLKANPGKYSYASPGYGTMPHIAGEWLYRLDNGIDITHVPFQGAAPAIQSVLSGQTPVFQIVIPVVRPHIAQGSIRALAIADTKRSHFFPDVPTLAEQGITGHEVSFWMAVFARADTPQAVLDVLQTQISRIMQLADIKQRIDTLGFEPRHSTAAELAALLKSETDKWSKVVRETKIKID